ncbi:TAXI family TRAP transporter solute-binding subunit [Bradyrhizobium sp. Tv2a-2]|uniref:TAXI family TRAP transporter solute-binding subunit n=1 Tax=Bradyrhizobium sp. Tv2a-2 TaxID=113395 RepID=UPI00041675A4|nr:TAXI family TRAP transporter solute-binding subunit [Bradyrhizobium sp. Tv2a-2]
MSAEVPTEPQEPQRPQLAITNRGQVVLFALLTLILTAFTVWAGRAWVKSSETLIFAVGAPNSEEAHFAERLAAVMKNTSSRFRLKIVTSTDNAKALSLFDRRLADLALLRTDAKIPPRARALAIVEHDPMLLISPGDKKIKTLDDLKKKKIAVLAEGEKNLAFVRNMLEALDAHDAASRVQLAPAGSTLQKLFSSGYGAVIAIFHLSNAIKNKSYAQYDKQGNFTLNAIDGTKGLARRIPGISDETIEAGTLSSAPEIPEDDLDTVGLEWLLVAQAHMSGTTAGDLARIIYENKSELALDDGFGSRIEPAVTDKDAFVMAHPGARDYINDDTKSFMDRYSDMMYLGAGALSVIGSVFAAIYSQITRVSPAKAGALATAILTIGEKVEHAHCLDDLELLQEELEKILRGAVIGLRDGTISGDGLETFKLGYEFVRDEIAMRRDYLQRHAECNALDVALLDAPGKPSKEAAE